MNAYLTQGVRDYFGLVWQEEYLLGMIAHHKEMPVTVIIKNSDGLMTLATAHKYITQLVIKEFVESTSGKDRRIKLLKLTSKGKEFLRKLSKVAHAELSV